ncbi:glycosyltransferase family 2 protein [Vibrio breoganii]|uniref:glycosyltransferase family 2 protein n=1 Tax=Vibrio breoganii TaxID=553239 RepID=UPI0002D6250E|nr:glycosyltransferase family 2 protein [Vibrio breoganii]OED97787.1 bactoprenol glucosyl transferase [Vibrio breoganii ZF-55]
MKISFVVPIYNEEESIPLFYREVRRCNEIDAFEVEIVFVNDGSSDGSESVICQLRSNDPLVKLINFTRNFGKESAIIAGLEHASGDAVIPIDVDLQDPIHVVPELISKWKNGADVVLAKRVDRSSDTWFKRKSAELFYFIHNKLSNNKIEGNVGDFRLLSKETVNNVLKLKESNLFIKGLLSWVGGEIEVVEYKREVRISGKTKFKPWALLKLAIDGITSFSTAPLKIWTYFGGVVSILSFLYAIWIIIDTLVWGNEVSGYASIIVSIFFFSGVQLISIGVLGEYIGRIYMEVKSRPRYLIKKDRRGF